jgi:hypothetical protein
MLAEAEAEEEGFGGGGLAVGGAEEVGGAVDR